MNKNMIKQLPEHLEEADMFANKISALSPEARMECVIHLTEKVIQDMGLQYEKLNYEATNIINCIDRLKNQGNPCA